MTRCRLITSAHNFRSKCNESQGVVHVSCLGAPSLNSWRRSRQLVRAPKGASIGRLVVGRPNNCIHLRTLRIYFRRCEQLWFVRQVSGLGVMSNCRVVYTNRVRKEVFIRCSLHLIRIHSTRANVRILTIVMGPNIRIRTRSTRLHL